MCSIGQASNLLLCLYAGVGSNTTKINQTMIANATKKSSHILIHKGVVSEQMPQSSSQLVERSDRRLEVQRPLSEGIGYTINQFHNPSNISLYPIRFVYNLCQMYSSRVARDFIYGTGA